VVCKCIRNWFYFSQKDLDNETARRNKRRSKDKEIAREVARGSSDSSLSLREKYNISIESALDFIESWIKEAGYPYVHDISGVDYNIHHFVIYQDMGLKWSLYLSEIFRNLFEELFNVTKVHFNMTDNTVVFTIDTGQDWG
jgi:hypothetical protein